MSSEPDTAGPARPTSGGDTVPATDVAAFLAVRPRLFGFAYRMLGSVAEAEDVVQDVWLRWQGTDRRAVHNPAAFLDHHHDPAGDQRRYVGAVHRETYVGPWLPEPVDTSADPTLGAERAEALDLAVLLLLEKLTPTERAAYVLREAFGYPYREIGAVLADLRGQRPPARRPGPAAPRLGPVDTRPAPRSGAGWPRRFSPPPATATWPPWSGSSPRT